ncbi:structural protein [Pseudomonas phage vB_PcuM_ KLEP17-4]|nr:structural protein [Pseudomonas phage vB_PcuM_ KLEP17-4]
MPVTLGVTRQYEFTGNDLNNRGCLFPRDTRNSVFVQFAGVNTKQIASDPAKYLAFPFMLKLGSSIVVLYSDGDAHASSDRQIMTRSDDNGASWSSVVFFENTAPGVYNTSLLTGLLAVNEYAVFKVWAVKNVAGALTVAQVPTVVDSGVTYALWSAVINSATTGTIYRTGYGSNGTNTQCGLLQSTDGGFTWTFKSLIFSGAGLNFSEAAIIRTTGNNLVAVCREDTGASNPLYYATSADDGATWSSATLIPTTTINGRQPNLIKTTNGRYILCTGDRAGTSGIGGGGEDIFGTDETGIAMTTSADCQAWGFRTMLAGTYSSDGGQPFAVETTANRVCVVFYHRRGLNKQPVIASTTLDTGEL